MSDWHDQIDNWGWVLLAIAVIIVAEKWSVPGLSVVSGLCIAKAREPNGRK